MKNKNSKPVLAIIFLPLVLAGCNATSPSTPSLSSPQTPQQQTPSPQSESSSQPFDYYLLNLSWSPEFCHSHPNARECDSHPAFVLHGLWPQNNNGSYPKQCDATTTPRNPRAFRDIYPDAGLLRHEWRTHGSCSGLSPDEFFTLARTAYQSVVIPSTLSQLDHPISLPPDQIITLFQQANPNIPASSLAISCGNNYLTAVEVCLNKSAQPIACGPIRSCRANTVRITPP